MRAATILSEGMAVAVAVAFAGTSAAADCQCPLEGIMMVGVQPIAYIQDGVTTTTTATSTW